MVALVRDPWWLYVYWELRAEIVAEAQAQLGAGADVRWVLRIFEKEASHPYKEVEVRSSAPDWYLEVKPDCTWYVEIGLKSAQGHFVKLLRSNCVITPPAGPSGESSENWQASSWGMGRHGHA